MTIQTELLALPSVIDDTHATITESYNIGSPYTYKLGTGSFPSTWQVIPRGAPKVPAPAAPSTISDKTTSIGHLPGSGTSRAWSLTYLTQYGESASGASATHAVAGSNNAVEIAFPALPNTPYNPVRGVGIYRSVAGTGGTKINVGFVEDIRITSFVDYFADNDLVSTAHEPLTTDSSGLASTVTVTGPLAAGGSGPWAELGYYAGMSIGTEQYAVSYLNDASGGTVYFSSADNGKTVSLAYTGAIDLSAAFFNSLIAGTKALAGTMASATAVTTQLAAQTGTTTWVTHSSVYNVTTGGGTRLDISFFQEYDASSAGLVAYTFLLDGTDVSGTGVTVGGSAATGAGGGPNGLYYSNNILIGRRTATVLHTHGAKLSAGSHSVQVLTYRASGPTYTLDPGFLNIREII